MKTATTQKRRVLNVRLNAVVSLLPCPFCGCKCIDGPHENQIGDSEDISWWVECTNYECIIDGAETEESARKAWNKRGNDYAYKDVQEYESIIKQPVNEAFRIGWDMARTTNAMLRNLAG